MTDRKKTRKGTTVRDSLPRGTGRLHELAAVFTTLAHPVRLLILEHLLEGVRCVKDLNELIPVSQPNLSQHMTALREAGLVDCQSNGPLRCYYILRPGLVKNLFACQPERHPVRQRTRESVLNELKRSRKEVQ